MKELSIEEKAKAYDEAIARAKVWKEKSGMPADRQGILDNIFPELKESEDVRKSLLRSAKDIKAYEDYWQQTMEKNFGELTVSYKPTKDQLNALKAIVLSLRQKAMTSNSRNTQYENLWDLYNNLKELK